MDWWQDGPEGPTPANRNPTPGPAEAAVVAEAEYLLNGSAGEQFAAAGDPVPGWAWLNALAHRSCERLGQLAQMPADGPWGPPVAVIARWLVEMSPPVRHRVQSKLFVSLELGALADLNWLPDLERIAWGVSGWGHNDRPPGLSS
jgi:hypothetical protein